MKALSIPQPWAWLTIRPDIVDPIDRADAYKGGLIRDVENRRQATRLRGRILVHTGRNYTPASHAQHADDIGQQFGIALPRFEDMSVGGIIGDVEIIGCVLNHASRWKRPGFWGFLLSAARPRPFLPCRGKLGFFDVDLA